MSHDRSPDTTEPDLAPAPHGGGGEVDLDEAHDTVPAMGAPATPGDSGALGSVGRALRDRPGGHTVFGALSLHTGPGSPEPATAPEPAAREVFTGADAVDESLDTAPVSGEVALEAMLGERYRLGPQIGEGAVGKVYQARHLGMDKRCAIKVLRADVARDPEIVERFRREARAASHIDHPNVCSAFDFGEAEGRLFLAMEYLDGPTLGSVLSREGRLPVARAVQVADEIAAALSAAHAQGIIHRDLKPENIFLVSREEQPEAQVKIADFGIARVYLGDDDGRVPEKLTRAGRVYGTPHYLSPEQAAGEPVSVRSDLYALGVVLYEMLTGRTPFDAESVPEMLRAHLRDPVPPLGFSVPPALERLVVQQLLAKDALDRPASAAWVRDRLREILASLDREPVALAAPIAPSHRPPIALFIGAGLALVALGMALVFALAGGSDGDDAADRAPDDPAATSVPAETDPAVIDPAVRLGELTAASPLADDERIQSARKLLDDGFPDAAVSLLAPLQGELGEDVVYGLLLADAYASADQHVEAMAVAESMARREPAVLADTALRNHVLASFYDRHEDRQQAAARVLSHGLTPELTELLLERATEGRVGSHRRLRERIVELLDEHGARETLEPWRQLVVELRLRDQTGCRSRREIVEEMQTLGDPRVLPTLELFRRDDDGDNECMARTLRDAIKSLEAKGAAP